MVLKTFSEIIFEWIENPWWLRFLRGKRLYMHDMSRESMLPIAYTTHAMSVYFCCSVFCFVFLSLVFFYISLGSADVRALLGCVRLCLWAAINHCRRIVLIDIRVCKSQSSTCRQVHMLLMLSPLLLLLSVVFFFCFTEKRPSLIILIADQSVEFLLS